MSQPQAAQSAAQTTARQAPNSSPVLAPKPFTGRGGLGTADTAWMQREAHGAVFDFEASRLARKTAQSEQVRKFAKMIVDDDTHSGNMLNTIAKANEVLLPEHPDPAQQKELDRLKSLNGAAFDAAYLKDMRIAYHDDLAAEQTEARAVRDRALMKFVRYQQSTDQKHARSAAQLQDAMSASSKG